MRTLLVDDDFISIFLTEKLLHQEEAAGSVTSFHSSQAALAHLLNQPPEQVPEIIFLDLNMPIMSGWGFLEALRPYQEQLLGRCRIYILTSSLAACDTARSKEFALVAGLIHKPLDAIEIQAIYAQYAVRNR